MLVETNKKNKVTCEKDMLFTARPPVKLAPEALLMLSVMLVTEAVVQVRNPLRTHKNRLQASIHCFT